MKKITVCVILLLAFCTHVAAQKEFVELRSRGAKPMRTFQYHQRSNFEVVNGNFNAALASANGYLLEVNNISVKQLKCNAKLNGKQFEVVLIDNSMDRTYTSNTDSKGILTITCMPNGGYELYYTGEVWREKQKVIVNAKLVGAVNHSKNVHTNK